MKHWIQTFGSGAFDLDDPDPDSITLEATIHALSQVSRYTGHTHVPYSVGQHCVLIARALRDEGYDATVQRAGLGHDFHESVIGDVSSPVKRVLGDAWKVLEERTWLAFARRFSFPRTLPAAVKLADLRMLNTERRQMLSPEPHDWCLPEAPAYSFKVTPWCPGRTRHQLQVECDRLGVM